MNITTSNKGSIGGAWECPRCRRINAPWLSHCDCPPDTITIDKMKFISGGSATYYDPDADEWKPLPFYNKYYSGIVPVVSNDSATYNSGDGPSRKHYYDKSATED